MGPEEIEQIHTLQRIHERKLQRLEMDIIKKRRELREETTILEHIKRRTEELQEKFVQEQARWKEKIEKSAQKREALLEMRYVLNTLRENIEKSEEEEVKQEGVVEKVKEEIKKLRSLEIRQHVKIEKFSSLIEGL